MIPKGQCFLCKASMKRSISLLWKGHLLAWLEKSNFFFMSVLKGGLTFLVPFSSLTRRRFNNSVSCNTISCHGSISHKRQHLPKAKRQKRAHALQNARARFCHRHQLRRQNWARARAHAMQKVNPTPPLSGFQRKLAFFYSSVGRGCFFFFWKAEKKTKAYI